MRFPPGGSGLRHLAIKRRPPFQAASFVFHLIAGPLGSLRFLLGLLFHDALPSTRLKAWRRADERGVTDYGELLTGDVLYGSKRLRLKPPVFLRLRPIAEIAAMALPNYSEFLLRSSDWVRYKRPGDCQYGNFSFSQVFPHSKITSKKFQKKFQGPPEEAPILRRCILWRHARWW